MDDTPVTADAEIEAIRACATALRQLTPSATLRSLAYLLSLYGERGTSEHVYALARARRQWEADQVAKASAHE